MNYLGDPALTLVRELKNLDEIWAQLFKSYGKVKIPRFCGYDSPLDIYTFREQFEKFVVPYVQRNLLPDTLKWNYLGDPALTLVKELKNMDEIWDRLFKSYGNASMLLLNKLGDLSKISGLDEITGDENLMHGISSLINVMLELRRLAGKYSLEHQLTRPWEDWEKSVN